MAVDPRTDAADERVRDIRFRQVPPGRGERVRTVVQHQPADLVRGGPAHACADRTHSRLADGRMLCWRPFELAGLAGLARAIDAELAGQPVPPTLGRRAATSDPGVFWPLWTRAEVRAKLHGIPILTWLMSVDWPADDDAGMPLEVVTVVHDGVVVSYGAAEPARVI